MRQFEENRYTLYIAFALAIGHAVPLYAYSMGWFNLLMSLFFFPVLGDLVALGLAVSVHGQGEGIQTGRWTGKLTFTAGIFYLLLLVGSLIISPLIKWNTFAIITLPFVASWFLLISFATGLIIRGVPKS